MKPSTVNFALSALNLAVAAVPPRNWTSVPCLVAAAWLGVLGALELKRGR